MPKQAVEVKLAPNVLSWARSSAGWTVAEVAKKLQVDSRQVEAWEVGAVPVSLAKLESLANYYKRPVAAFLLPRPPQTPSTPPDFRYLPDKPGMLSKETRLALRRARRLQAVAADLMQALERPTRPILGTASSDDDPEAVVSRERARFGVSSSQGESKKASEALWDWRDLLERANILTFQMQMPVQDSRGFSLAEKEPYVVVVSSEDSEYARIFTLFHEYGHLMMRSSGICIPRGEEASGQPDKTERWCDHFAGAFLMPREELRQDGDCKAFLLEVPQKETRLSRLSRRYTASRLAVLTRLRMLGWLSGERYAYEVGALGASSTRRGGRSEYANRPIARNGRTFTSLVFQALEQNVVGYNAMADYLGIRLKHVVRLRELLSV